jgi:iduronate 2-sulfatase
MGYSMRTDRYRYTEWAKFKYAPEYRPNWNKLKGVELYDHNVDPEENVNRASHPEYAEIVHNLSGMLHAGWRDTNTEHFEHTEL